MVTDSGANHTPCAPILRRTILGGLFVALGLPPSSGRGAGLIVPDTAFSVGFDADLRKDLRRRLHEARWSDAVTSDWSRGMDREFLRSIVDYWLTGYDFDAAERRLNALPQHRALIGGFGIHYV